MIKGKRVRLRAVERDDLPRFVAWFNDPEVLRGLTMFTPMRLADEEEWYENLAQRPMVERAFALDALDAGEWVHIGSCNLNDVDWRVRKAEAGIAIGEKAYWDQGYGSEAMLLLMEHAFNTLNLNRLSLCVFDHNDRAKHVYERLGFQIEGRLRQDHFYQGAYVDTLVMGILADEYMKR